jgi:hypothetical protein
VRGRGKGGASSTYYSSEDLLNKNLSYTYHQKHTENDMFNENLLNKKLFKDFLRGIFYFKKIFCFNHPGLFSFFYKKGFLNSQAVRIRVNRA